MADDAASQEGAPSLDLPPPRTDLAKARQDLEQFGLTRFVGALPDRQVAELRERLAAQARGEEAKGQRWSDGANQRLWTMINKGEVFRQWATNPVLLYLMGCLLGPEILLYSYTANIAHRGGAPMRLHGDQQFRGLPHLPCSILANSILMLVDFTEDNGATRVAPGTHRLGRWPAEGEPESPSIPATGPAGTLLVYDGRLWHGTGANRTASPRYGLLTAYSRPFVRQQENLTLTVAPNVLEHCSDELKILLGFQTWTGGGALGMINGSLPGAISERPTRYSAELSA
jgi:ectoine hydroxylase-related dioxygenase (phytanoyl-CoA dioxygenase family)